MWSYYGAKTNIVHLYPPPKFDKIIEPFAGTARYALKYFDRDVLLIDKYPTIVNIWKWLQSCSPNDVLRLPRIKEGENINNFTFDCQEARDLMGFVIGFGFTTPRDLAIPRSRHRPNSQNYTLKRIASQIWKIKHWEIWSGSYEEIENEKATWFIDAPYQFGGHAYRFGNKNIDFKHLSDWCKSRYGQVIVCENNKADWMNFTPMIEQNVLSGKNYEVIYSNLETSFDYSQLKLF